MGHSHTRREEGTMGTRIARPAVESAPRYARGVLIVTRQRARRRADILWGCAIGLSLVALPALMGIASGALS